MLSMHNDLDRILIDSSQIALRVKEVASQIARDLAANGADDPSRQGRLTLVPILTGSVIFLADLIRHMPMFMRIELISVSSYPGVHTTPGKLRILTDLHALNLKGRDVLLVDDILDSGQTLAAVAQALKDRSQGFLDGLKKRGAVSLWTFASSPKRIDASGVALDRWTIPSIPGGPPCDATSSAGRARCGSGISARAPRRSPRCSTASSIPGAAWARTCRIATTR